MGAKEKKKERGKAREAKGGGGKKKAWKRKLGTGRKKQMPVT